MNIKPGSAYNRLKVKFSNGDTFDTMNKDGTYGVQEKPEANTSWTTGVSMAGNMVQGTQDFSKSPNASMYKTEDAVWDTVGQLGPQGALIGGITDMMNTALRPIRESNDKKAGTSGYNEGLTIAGGLLNPLASLQTRGKYEGGYTDITGEGYEKYMAGLNRRAKFRENIGDFDANMNANINQISYLNSSPTFAKGGKVPPGDNATPTFNDSLAIYNNTQELKKFYSPEKGYEMVDNYTVNPSDYKYWFKRDNESIIKSIRDLAKEEANVENAKSNAQLYPNTYKSPTDFLQAITKSISNTKFNNPYQVQVQDRVSGEINWKAPLNISDSRIIPDKIASYYSYSDPGVMTDIYEYDPLKVKPYSMLTEAEKKARLEKYGTDGFPASYKNSNATSNTSSAPTPVVKPRPDLSLDKLPIKSAELTYNSEIPIQKVPEARVDSMSNLERYIPYTANYGNPNLPQGYWDKGMGKKETQYANGGQMTTEYKTGGTHEQNPNGGIPIGNSLMEEGEIRFDYLENKQPKSYIFSNRIKYKK